MGVITGRGVRSDAFLLCSLKQGKSRKKKKLREEKSIRLNHQNEEHDRNINTKIHWGNSQNIGRVLVWYVHAKGEEGGARNSKGRTLISALKGERALDV